MREETLRCVNIEIKLSDIKKLHVFYYIRIGIEKIMLKRIEGFFRAFKTISKEILISKKLFIAKNIYLRRKVKILRCIIAILQTHCVQYCRIVEISAVKYHQHRCDVIYLY